MQKVITRDVFVKIYGSYFELLPNESDKSNIAFILQEHPGSYRCSNTIQT